MILGPVPLMTETFPSKLNTSRFLESSKLGDSTAYSVLMAKKLVRSIFFEKLIFFELIPSKRIIVTDSLEHDVK